ncbi:MAG TPA: MnhB domain-containing protein [Acidimicrobiales bacterium]|nr:MnhB domain-containing protein [Acidimicrobiales bacterium]
MSRSVRLAVFLVAAGGVAVLVVLAAFGLQSFGGSYHPYRTHAVGGAVLHRTANVVSSVNFDQRALDTLGEETILLGSVVAAAVLLRPSEDETESEPARAGRVLASTRLLGYLFMAVAMVIGLDVVTHGHLTPGGGFQGGVVLATGIHLLYVGGSYRALERARPVPVLEWGEAVGAAAFACLGIAALLVAGAFLANVIPTGTFGQLFSGGTVPVLNGAVGIEVASGAAVLLAVFLTQALAVSPGRRRR